MYTNLSFSQAGRQDAKDGAGDRHAVSPCSTGVTCPCSLKSREAVLPLLLSVCTPSRFGCYFGSWGTLQQVGPYWRKWVTGVGLNCKCRVIVQLPFLGGALCFLVKQEQAVLVPGSSVTSRAISCPAFLSMKHPLTMSHRNLSKCFCEET